MDANLRTLDSKTGKAPITRITDAISLNAVVRKIIYSDTYSALARQDIQAAADGAPPFDARHLSDTGQHGRCNLNFGDMKARLKAEMAGYYDLTDSVPTLAIPLTDFGDPLQRPGWNNIMAEEWHRMLKEWSCFDPYFQLLIQKFTTHGLGFLYFPDEVDWKWQVAGLEDFKLPRGTLANEEEVDIAIAMRDISVGRMYQYIKDLDPKDKRWNVKEVQKAIVNAVDQNLIFTVGAWEKLQQILKNNDIFATAMSQETVKLVHVWIREFSGRVSQYLTLRSFGNDDFLFKCENRFDNINQCFTYFPFEVGSNGTLHSIRGLAHEIYPIVQVLNTLRCQTVDNAKFAGSLLLQPKTPSDAEDMALLFYGGAIYMPPGLQVQNSQLNNPSTSILPIIQEMSLTMRTNTGDFLSKSTDETNEKTKFEVQSELMKEAVLPTASMNLFYQPWGRHLNEVWRRTASRTLRPKDPGGREVWDFRKRCHERGVPLEAIYNTPRVMPVRAVGYGSPTNRLLALDEFMQYYGSLDPVGQNALLRDRFAQRCGYSQVDRYVPTITTGGRMPVDLEIAELQNSVMSAGTPATVVPNDNHILHTQVHLPSLTGDLDALESGQVTPQLIQGAQVKLQHISQHMQVVKPDKLQGKLVAELTRQVSNAQERVQAAMDHAQQLQSKQAAQGQQQTSDQALKAQESQAEQRRKDQAHAQQMKHNQEKSDQERALKDAEAATRTHAHIVDVTSNQNPANQAAELGIKTRESQAEQRRKDEAHAQKMAESKAEQRRKEEEHQQNLKVIEAKAKAAAKPKPAP